MVTIFTGLNSCLVYKIERIYLVAIGMPKSEETSWLTITVAGAIAGVNVASYTYVAGHTASGIVSKTTGITMNILGTIACVGTRMFFGDTASHTVKIISDSIALTSETNVRNSGMITSGIIAAGAGAVTALSVTIGTRIVEYSVSYGGKISKEIALKLAEAYLQYKLSYDTPDMDDKWLVIESNGATSLQSFALTDKMEVFSPSCL